MPYKIKLFLYVTLCASVLLGCADNNEKIQVTPDSVIIAFGDSLTKGTGAKPHNSYPSVLQNILGVKVLNKGVAGEKSGKGLLRLEKTLASTSPDLVILCHGGNDILKGLPLDKLEENLNGMIELIQSYGADVLLVGVPKPSLNLSSLALYESLADNNHLVADLKILSNLLEQVSMKSDRVHLNDKGYRQLAIALANKIEVR